MSKGWWNKQNKNCCTGLDMQFQSSRITLLNANLNIVTQWCAENISSPNTGCFFMSVTAFEKIKKQFFYSFTDLPQCRQSIDSLIYVYSIQILSCFLWVLDHYCDRTSLYCRHPKKNSVLPPAYRHYFIQYTSNENQSS